MEAGKNNFDWIVAPCSSSKVSCKNKSHLIKFLVCCSLTLHYRCQSTSRPPPRLILRTEGEGFKEKKQRGEAHKKNRGVERDLTKKEQLKKRSSPKKIYELKAFRCNIREWIGSWKKLWTNGVCGVCLETTATFQSIMSETLRLAKRFIKLTKGIKGSVRTINQFD